MPVEANLTHASLQNVSVLPTVHSRLLGNFISFICSDFIANVSRDQVPGKNSVAAKNDLWLIIDDYAS